MGQKSVAWKNILSSKTADQFLILISNTVSLILNNTYLHSEQSDTIRWLPQETCAESWNDMRITCRNFWNQINSKFRKTLNKNHIYMCSRHVRGQGWIPGDWFDYNGWITHNYSVVLKSQFIASYTYIHETELCVFF